MGDVPSVLAGRVLPAAEAAAQLVVTGQRRAARVSPCLPGGDWIQAGELIVRCAKYGWCHQSCLTEAQNRSAR